MIILASSSVTRAKVLRDDGVKFEQVFFDYDESGVDKNLPPYVYVQKIVAAKKEQFLKANENVKNVVFADSVVVCDGKILNRLHIDDRHKANSFLNRRRFNHLLFL